MEKKLSIPHELIIAIAAFAICRFFFVTIDDNEVGSLLPNMAASQFSNFSFIDLCFLGFVFVNQLYKAIYFVFPGYNWMGIIFLSLQFLCLYMLLRIIKNIVFKQGGNALFILIVQIFFTLYFVENIFTLSHTRFALIFCGLSLINLVFTPQIKTKDIIINTLIFIFGMLHRPESSMGMLLLVACGYLIYRFDLRFIARRFFLPSCATIILFTVISFDWWSSNLFVKKVEPEIEYKLMGHRVVPLSAMKTPADSIKYELGIRGMWFDPNVVTPEFLRSILLPGPDMRTEHAHAVLLHVATFYRYYLLIPLAIVVLILMCVFTGNPMVTVFQIIALQLITFVIIYQLDYTGFLVDYRHFINLQLISLLITCIYFVNSMVPVTLLIRHKLLLTGCALIMLYGAVSTLFNYKQSNNGAVLTIAKREKYMQAVEKAYSNKIIIVTLKSFGLFDHTFSIKNQNYTNNTYLLGDVFTYQLMPKYSNYISDKCSCNPQDPVQFFNWLADTNAIYLSDSLTYQLTARYMRIIHSKDIRFIKPNGPDKLAGTDNLATKDCELRLVNSDLP